MRKVFAVAVLGSALVLNGCGSSSGEEAFTVPGSSMEPLIRAGQTIEASRVTAYKPHVGDVVVFRTPIDWDIPGGLLIKRVLGTPGEHVSCDPHKSGGDVVVDGKALDESSYLPKRTVFPSAGSEDLIPSTKPCQKAFSVVVPKGDIWLMGDNRGNSSDSRFHMYGPSRGAVPASNVLAVYKVG